MTQFKSILKGLLTFFALSLTAGSTLEELQSTEIGQKQTALPVIVFLAVVTLHWLIWQFIVPGYRVFGGDSKSLLIYPVPHSFFSYSITIGYVFVALHCLTFGGHLNEFGSPVSFGHLVFGLTFIGLGIAARLRSVMYELQHRTKHDDPTRARADWKWSDDKRVRVPPE